MSIQLSGADLIDLAVQTEVRGETFYRQAAERADQAAAKELFAHLAREEVRHKETFERLAQRIVITEIDPDAWQEAVDYIAAIVEGEFFRANAPIVTIPEQASVPDMLRQAIAFEKQSVLYFFTLRDLVQPANRPIVNAILDEERDHVRRLAALLPGRD
jgi:rubrerythrin